ncbi:MAG: glycosyltransferase family 39 protein [Candidatus Thorarchaeota archaeon]
METEEDKSLDGNSRDSVKFPSEVASYYLSKAKVFWNVINPWTRILIVWTLSAMFYMLLVYIEIPILSAVGSLVFGFLSFILIPGYTISVKYLDSRRVNLATGIVLGFILCIAEIHMQFLLAVFLGIQLHLALWLLLLQAIVVPSLLISLHKSNIELPSLDTLRGEHSRFVVWILVLAFSVRLILLFFTGDSIAPDASLYASYARAIVSGDFDILLVNDASVTTLTNGVDTITHQGFSYFFAISWLLLSPFASGPTLILTIIGTMLIIPVYEITRRFFGVFAAQMASVMLAVHPTFVFHSSVGFGPEITSVFFLLISTVILASEDSKKPESLIIAGVLFGFVDLIWDPYFYVGCLFLPLVLRGIRRIDTRQTIIFSTSIMLVFLSRVLISNLMLLASCWLAIVLIHLLLYLRREKFAKVSSLFFTGVILSLLFFRIPIEVSKIYANVTIKSGAVPFINAITSPITQQLVSGFLIFVLFHVTPVILIVVLYGLIRGSNRRYAALLFVLGLITAAGTLKVFGLMGESLQLQYIYSDSRFFLLVTLMLLIAAGATFSSSSIIPNQTYNFASVISKNGKRVKVITLLIMIGFIPGYAAIPFGLSQISISERYGWSDLDLLLADVPNPGSVIIVDRAREFHWSTGYAAVSLVLSEIGLSEVDSAQEILNLSSRYDAQYILFDAYTISHWRTLDYLWLDTIDLDSLMPFNITQIVRNAPDSIPLLDSLRLIAESPPNSNGYYSRLYQITSAGHWTARNLSLLDDGWIASNGGSILNVTGVPRLVINDGMQNTSTLRQGEYDLNTTVGNGIIRFEFGESNAEVHEIEIYNMDGDLIRTATRFDDNTYYCIVGNSIIGDIRIMIVGESGSYIEIDSIKYWRIDST